MRIKDKFYIERYAKNIISKMEVIFFALLEEIKRNFGKFIEIYCIRIIMRVNTIKNSY